MNFSNTKFSVGIDWESFTRINYRPLIFGMIAVFLFKLATLAGFETPTFINPVVETQTVEEQVTEKLMMKGHEFTINENYSLIPEARAAGEYDNAHSYVLIDLDTGDVITEKQADQEFSIASVTKIMTAVVALDLASSEETFLVTEHAAGIIPTKIGVVPGEKMTLEELLKASLLTSANDATEVIKEGIDIKFGEEVFIDAMNTKADFLGMEHTSFSNAQGFDNPNHYSTAYDMALLTQYALTQYPEIVKIVEDDYEFLEANNMHKQFDLYNWNGLLGVYPDTYGVKIGNTGDAGYTTIVASRRGGKNIAVVLFGAPGVRERDMWAAQLLDRGYVQTLGLVPVEITEEELQQKYDSWEYFN